MLESYTTRPKRTPDEKGHIFVNDLEFEKYKDDLCAYTEFDGYKYWATNKQVDECDIYIIDPAGVEYFKTQYKGDKYPLTIELLADKKTRRQRMFNRGDSKKDVERRLKHDKAAFKDFNADVKINANLSIEEVVSNVDFAIRMTDVLMKGQKPTYEK